MLVALAVATAVLAIAVAALLVRPVRVRKLYFSEAALGTNPPVNFFITVDGQQPRLFTKDEPPAIITV